MSVKLVPEDGSYTALDVGATWSLTYPDNETFRFEVRPGDTVTVGTSTSQRSDVIVNDPIVNGTPFHVNFNLVVEPGDPNTATYLVLGEMAQTMADGSTVNPPFDIDLVSDQMVVYVRYTNADGTVSGKQVYADLTSITRGQTYNLDVTSVLDPSGNGRLVIKRDGVTIVDYAGPLGYATGQSASWEEGIRRSADATGTMAVDFSDNTIDTGDAVQLPPPTAFLPAPSLLISSINLVNNTGSTDTMPEYAVSIYGQATWRSTVSFYVDGRYAGSTTSDGASNYTATIDVDAMGLHRIYAVSDNGSGTPGIASYPATFSAVLPSDPAVDTAGNYIITLDGAAYWVQNALRSYSLTSPAPDTMRFEVRSHDVFIWDYNNSHATTRSELWGQTVYNDGTPIDIRYQLMVEPGLPNSSAFLVLGQLHADNNAVVPSTGPGFALGLSGEYMTVTINYSAPDGSGISKVLFTDTAPIQRGRYYDIEVKTIFGPAGNGRLVVIRDGQTIVDYSGPLGYVGETGVYWKEGIYRDFNAPETIAADFKGLTVDSGPSVIFPNPDDFIPAPKLSVSSIGAVAADGSRVASIVGIAKPGNTVSIFENGVTMGQATVDANGNFSANIVLNGDGLHQLSAVGINAEGKTGPASGPLSIEIGTAADIVNRIASIVRETGLGAVVLTDTSVLSVSSVTQMSSLIHQYAAVLAKIQQPYSFLVTTTVTGKTYDTQKEFYTASGVLTERIRYANGVNVYDLTVAPDGSQVLRSLNTSTNGYDVSIYNAAGAIVELDQYTSGNILYNKDQRFSDGTRLISTFNSTTGAATGTTQYAADKSKVVTTLGITGQSYVKQVISYDPTGKMILQQRYNAAGTLTYAGIWRANGDVELHNYDPVSGAETSYSITKADGTVIRATFAITGKPYAGQIITTSSTGTMLQKDLLDANRKLLSSDTWLPGQWHRVYAVDPNGLETGYTQLNVDGSSIVVVFQPGQPTLLVSVTAFNASGTKLSTDVYAPDGSHALTTFDGAGVCTSSTQFNVDGSKRTSTYQPGSSNLLASVLVYNASGALVETDSYSATGVLQSSDVADPAGGHVVSVFDSSGQVVIVTRYLADGSYTVSAYQGTPSLLASITSYNASGLVLSGDVYAADGSHVLTTFDPASGTVYMVAQLAVDGSRAVTTYGSGGRIASVISYDPANFVLSSDLFNPDGSDILTIYDRSSGLVQSTTATAVDGSRTVTQYVAGSTALASIKAYAASGILVSADVYDSQGHTVTVYDALSGLALSATRYNPDGSSLVTSYAADGVTIASIKAFGADGNPTAYQIWNSDGSTKSYVFDSKTHLPSGYALVAADGSRLLAIFTPGNESLLSMTSRYDSTGRLTEIDNFDSAGHRLSMDSRNSDGSRIVTSYDPNTGAVAQTTTYNTDGTRIVDLIVTGKPYAEQSSTYNAAGKLVAMTRWYGGSSHIVAFQQVMRADGSGETCNYDTLGRETSSQIVATDGSLDQFAMTYSGTGTQPTSVQQNHYSPTGQKLWTDITLADGSHKQTAYQAGAVLTSRTGVTDVFASAFAGSDTFVFGPNFRADTITGFHAGTGTGYDVLNLRAYPLSLAPNQSAYDYLMAASRQVGNDMVISLSGTDAITLKNTVIANMTPSNFLV